MSAMGAAEELLVKTRRTSEMGKNTMERLIPMIKDRNLRSLAQIQLNEYSRILMSSEILLQQAGAVTSGTGSSTGSSNSVMLDVSAVAGQAAPRAAAMMVEGTDRGIRDMDVALAQYGTSSSAESYNLAATLRDVLYRNRRELQRYR